MNSFGFPLVANLLSFSVLNELFGTLSESLLRIILHIIVGKSSGLLRKHPSINYVNYYVMSGGDGLAKVYTHFKN